MKLQILFVYTVFVLQRCKAVPLEKNVGDTLTSNVSTPAPNAPLKVQPEASSPATPQLNNGTDDVTRKNTTPTVVRDAEISSISPVTNITEKTTESAIKVTAVTENVGNKQAKVITSDNATSSTPLPKNVTDTEVKNSTPKTNLTGDASSTSAPVSQPPTTELPVTSEPVSEVPSTTTTITTTELPIATESADSLPNTSNETSEWSGGQIAAVVLGTLAGVAILGVLGKFAWAKFK